MQGFSDGIALSWFALDAEPVRTPISGPKKKE